MLCSTADPAVIPGGSTLNTVPADNFNALFELSGRNDPTTHSYLSGSTGYILSNNVPLIAAHTFTQDPSNPFAKVGGFLLPLAQLRGLTRDQYLNYWALPNFANGARNNAIVLVVVPPGTTSWSGIAGPITNANANALPGGALPFWGLGGGTQYFVGSPELTGSRSIFQIQPQNYIFPTPVVDFAPG